MTVQELVRDLTQNSPNTRLSFAQTEQLEQILADYLEGLEQGAAPDTSAIVAQYPELAAELRENFDKLEALHRAAVGMTDGGETLDQLCLTNLTEQRTLGDFRLIRPIGRGGMGLVYEAEQISLNRRVALKTLPLAAVLDPKQLARFKNEAQAAASLDHPHIVSVHAVGADRGVHYYAMQLIEGQSLAEVIAVMRRGTPSPPAPSPWVRGPGERDSRDTGIDIANGDTAKAALSTLPDFDSREYYRTIARLGIQAAEALHYAHEMGVVHRDVKPSNLLLDNDAQLYVTDFGLAMTQSDSNLTMTGDLLGTLRYMSPEQASGQRALVDRRTDIYSLGASLYELATLQPAFPEENRTRLLQQIVADPPQLPSQINKAIPADLETIILKAMAKEPTERYATAQELADDLNRHLNDEPIRARRPSATERVTKWSRRHRKLVASSFVILLLSVIGSSVSALLISQQRDAAQAAASDAKTQRTRAEGNLRQARAAVDRMFTKVAEELADRPQMEQLRRELLEEALVFYQGFLQESDEDPEIRFETALVHERVADIYNTLGNHGNRLKHCQSQHRIVLALHQKFPEETRYRELLARSCGHVGEVLVNLNRLEGEAQLDAALAEWMRLAADYPTNPLYRKQVAAWHLNWPWWQSWSTSSANPAEAVSELRNGLHLLDDLERDFPKYPKDNVLRAQGHGWLGGFLIHVSKCDEAEAHLRKALELDESQVEDTTLARVLIMRGALDEAEAFLQKAIQKTEGLREEHPDSHSPDFTLNQHLEFLSYTLMTAERWEEAVDATRRRLEIDTKWHDRFPEDKRYRVDFAWSTYELGNVLFGAGKHQESADAHQRAIALFDAVAEQFPDTAQYQNYLAWVLSTCPAKELHNPRRAVEIAQRALKLSPENPDYWAVMARAQYIAGDYRAVIVSTEEARKYFGDRLPSDAKLVLAMAHHQLGDPERGREIYRETVNELENKKTYSEWYTMEFRVLRADADQMFAVPPS